MTDKLDLSLSPKERPPADMGNSTFTSVCPLVRPLIEIAVLPLYPCNVLVTLRFCLTGAVVVYLKRLSTKDIVSREWKDFRSDLVACFLLNATVSFLDSTFSGEQPVIVILSSTCTVVSSKKSLEVIHQYRLLCFRWE